VNVYNRFIDYGTEYTGNLHHQCIDKKYCDFIEEMYDYYDPTPKFSYNRYNTYYLGFISCPKENNREYTIECKPIRLPFICNKNMIFDFFLQNIGKYFIPFDTKIFKPIEFELYYVEQSLIQINNDDYFVLNSGFINKEFVYGDKDTYVIVQKDILFFDFNEILDLPNDINEIIYCYNDSELANKTILVTGTFFDSTDNKNVTFKINHT
jgi:hypothetical protein